MDARRCPIADELTINASVQYADANDVQMSLACPTDFLATIASATPLAYQGSQSIGTSETAINLGGISSLGYMLLVNRDPVNYVDIKTGTGGTIFARLDPAGGMLLLKVGSGVTAPYAIANTAACVIEKFVGAL